jgi:hypothetical protein
MKQIISRLACMSVAMLIVAGATPAFAAPITYGFDYSFGGLTASGTLQTDGTIGALAISNFIAWSVTVTDGVTSDTFTQTNSSFLDPEFNNISATPTTLEVSPNFGEINLIYGAFHGILFVNNNPLLTNSTSMFIGDPIQGTLVRCFGNPTGCSTYDGHTLATVVGPTPVPEPATLVMLGTGLVGLVAGGRRKVARRAFV